MPPPPPRDEWEQSGGLPPPRIQPLVYNRYPSPFLYPDVAKVMRSLQIYGDVQRMPSNEVVQHIRGYVDQVSDLVKTRREYLDMRGQMFKHPEVRENITGIMETTRAAMRIDPPPSPVAKAERKTAELSDYEQYLDERREFDAFEARWHQTEMLLRRLLSLYEAHTRVETEVGMDGNDEDFQRQMRTLYGPDVDGAGVLKTSLLQYFNSDRSKPGVITTAAVSDELKRHLCDSASVMGDANVRFSCCVERMVTELQKAFPQPKEAEAA